MRTPKFQGETAIICGTGPSVTEHVIDLCNKAKAEGKVRLFGINLSYQYFDVDVMNACNYQFYDYYYPRDEKLRNGKFDKWTTRPELKGKYPTVEYIEEIWIPGFSTDPSKISAHHGSSAQAMNLALHYGIKRQLLIGFDMRHKDKRHYFGEYPEPMRHITRNLGPDGELIGLIKEMETIKPEDYDIEIINCTPGSAMTCFPMGRLEDYL